MKQPDNSLVQFLSNKTYTIAIQQHITDLIEALLHPAEVQVAQLYHEVLDNWESKLAAAASKKAYDAYIGYQNILSQRHANLKHRLFLDGLTFGLAHSFPEPAALQHALRHSQLEATAALAAQHETHLQQAASQFFDVAGESGAGDVVEGLQTSLLAYFHDIERAAFLFGAEFGGRLTAMDD